MAKKKPEVNKSQEIRDRIDAIPPAELPTAKPKRVLDELKAAGFKIDNSMKSTTSKLLTIAKQNAANSPAAASTASVQPENGRTGQATVEIAIELVKACGSFEAARTTLTKLEQLLQSVPRL